MASVAIDTLQFARRLKAVGVPEQQAETQAELMGEAFAVYDDLVTRDYLDTRLDARLFEQDARVDARFSKQDVRIDAQFANQDARIDAQFAEQNVVIIEIKTELRWFKWLLVTVAASTVGPLLLGLMKL